MKKFKISAIVLVMAMCFTFFCGCSSDDELTVDSVSVAPYDAVEKGTSLLVEDLDSKFNNITSALDEITAGVATYKADILIPDSSNFEIEAVVDHQAEAYSGSSSIGAEGVSMDLAFWGDKENLVFNAPLLLGSDNYGVNLTTYEEDLKSSDFIELILGGSYEESEGSENATSFRKLMSLYDITSWKSAFDSLVTDNREYMTKQKPTVTEESLAAGEEGMEVIAVEYVLDAEAFEEYQKNVLLKFCQNLINDSTVSYEDVFQNENTEDITFKYYLDKESSRLVAFDTAQGEEKFNLIIFDAQTIDIKCSMTFSSEILSGQDSANVYSNSGNADPESSPVISDMTITIKEVVGDGKSEFNVEVKTKANDEPEQTSTISFTRADESGKYELSGRSFDGEEFKITGLLVYDAKEFVFTVDSMVSDDVATGTSVEIEIKAGGTVEKVPDYHNLLTMSTDDLSQIDGLFGYMFAYSGEYGDDNIDDMTFDWTTDEIFGVF